MLYRTASDAGILAETLLEEQLPFQMKEHLNNLYDHAVGQDIEAYFHLALGQCDRKCFLQVANKTESLYRPRQYERRNRKL